MRDLLHGIPYYHLAMCVCICLPLLYSPSVYLILHLWNAAINWNCINLGIINRGATAIAACLVAWRWTTNDQPDPIGRHIGYAASGRGSWHYRCCAQRVCHRLLPAQAQRETTETRYIIIINIKEALLFLYLLLLLQFFLSLRNYCWYFFCFFLSVRAAPEHVPCGQPQ